MLVVLDTSLSSKAVGPCGKVRHTSHTMQKAPKSFIKLAETHVLRRNLVYKMNRS